MRRVSEISGVAAAFDGIAGIWVTRRNKTRAPGSGEGVAASLRFC